MLPEAVLDCRTDESVALVAGTHARGSRSRYRNRVAHGHLQASGLRAVILFACDLAAFFFASMVSAATMAIGRREEVTLAYHRLTNLGIAWHGWETLVVLAILLMHLAGRGHYTRRIPFWTELGDLLRSTCIALLFDFILATKVYGVTFSSEAIFRWVLFVPLAVALRGMARVVLGRMGLWSLRTIIVGDEGAARSAQAALSSDRSLGYDVVDLVPFERLCASNEPYLWQHLLESRHADYVVVALSGGESKEIQSKLGELALARVPFAIMPTFGGLPVFGFDAQYFFTHDVMLLVDRKNLFLPFNRALKLVFDYAVAFLILLLVSPLFVLLALLVKRDGGPAFFHHQRIGSNGQPFACLKFRTMVRDADGVLRQVLSRDPVAAAEWMETQKLRDDPRVTRLGRFLRATSLDELPQLLNVLRGEMSLVGPRPIVADESAHYGKSLSFYAEAKPGITGLWQVSGRSRTSYERRVELDVWYVKNWTLWHDIAILFKTVPAVLWRDGAI